MTPPLLTTKLTLPPRRAGLVSRPRLLARLAAGLESGRRMTLVSAPAGFGKTTLVAEWLRSAPAEQAVAWLSLDETDSDPARFLAYLQGALRTAVPAILPALIPAALAPNWEAQLTGLINGLAGAGQPVILVLDDYHTIKGLLVHSQLTFLVEHQPASLHLVVATREDPPLPLARLRAAGQLVEVRQSDLQFTITEAAEFLTQAVTASLSSADIHRLHARTEGWIVGLQLAAVSLQDGLDTPRRVEAFAGSQRHVLDYLIDEVFRWQPPDIQDFLLRTALLSRFCAELCDALRDDGRPTTDDRPPAVASGGRSSVVLERLERANLFIVPLDEARQWYRYHHLFADLLRHRLEITCAADVPGLHRRASRWYAGHGLPAEAVDHALAASDWDFAAELIRSGLSTHLMKQGELVTLLGWLRAFPEAMLRADPQLCYEYAWPLILTGQLEAARTYLEQAERASQGQAEHVVLLGQVLAARAHLARVEGDHGRAVALSEQALALLPEAEWASRSAVTLNLGMARWYQGRLAEAEKMLGEAQQAGARSENHYARLTASIFLNRIQIARGKLRQGAAICEQLIQEAGQASILALACYDLGRLQREWNDLSAAEASTRRGLALSERGGNAEMLAGGYASLALILAGQGSTSAPQAALHEADRLLWQPGVSPAGHLNNLTAHILVALARGDLDTARLAAERIPAREAAESFPDYLPLLLARARLLLAQGEKPAAAGQLRALVELARPAGWLSILLPAQILLALTASTPEVALVPLAEALKSGQAEGYLRAFADAGEALRPLLLEAARRGIAPEHVGRILAVLDGGVRPAASAAPSLVETLSEREVEVLRLMMAGLSNREIAEKLIISPGTAKTHIHHLCGKLGARNRTEAAMRARELGLA